ncbi:MAG: BMC domain-containing protein [Candidatus Latescibacterota bacterium]|jgi:microcompartment protein CcmL/EutN
MEAALGLIEVEGVAGIILASDAACKAAEVELLGWESTGGFTTVFFGGSLSSVTAALRGGEAAAREVTDKVVAAPLSRPEPACRQQFSFPVDPSIQVRPGALGLLETRGYAAQVIANDRMVKAAAVEVINVLTVHNRVVCSLIQGDVGAVKEAIAVGRQVLAGYEHLLAAAVIPQPVPAVLQAFGPRPQTAGGGV